MPRGTNVRPPTSTMHVGLLVEDNPFTQDIHAYFHSAEGSPPAVRVPEISQILAPRNWLPWLTRFVFSSDSSTQLRDITSKQASTTDELLTLYGTGLHNVTRKINCGIEPKEGTAKWIYTDLIQYKLISDTFQVLTAVLLKSTLFWCVKSCLHIPDDWTRLVTSVLSVITDSLDILNCEPVLNL
jgi:hypothetical protein